MGLNLVKGFMLILLAVVLIGLIGVIIVSILNTASEGVMPTQSRNIANESLTTVDRGERLIYATRVNAVCTVNACINQTSEEEIPTTNWTEVSECAVSWTGSSSDANMYNSSNWNCSYSVTYLEGYATQMLRNTSSGIAEFFDDAGTWLTLLSVVVIILIIAVVILAVNRFGGRGGGVGGVITSGRRRRVTDSTEL